MYEEYFGLKRPPFRITPDTSLFYDGGHRGDILGALVYAIHRGEGIIKVVGEVGSGKTMLCRMLQLELPEEVEIIYIGNPSVSPEDILFVIANELHFDIARDASKHEVVTMLQNYLLKKHVEDKQVVLFVEEAQSMPLETLEEIRLLSNLETDQHKLLQIILFGQPELDDNLANNSIRQLRERITHDFNLKPLTAEEIHKYLNFRMREVGYTGPELISPKLSAKMAVYSAGLLRRINILADKMMLSAFADGTHTLTQKHLMAAVKDSGFSTLGGNKGVSRKFWIILGSGLMLLALFIWAYQYQSFININAEIPNQSKTASPLPEKVEEPAKINPLSVITEQPEDVIEEPSPLKSKVEVHETASLIDIYEQSFEQQNRLADKERVERVKEILALDEKVHTNSQIEPKKNQQNLAKLDKVNVNQPVESNSSSKQSDDSLKWLETKIESSKRWLEQADKQGVSIQVMMRNKSAAKELAVYLLTEWPLDLDKTFLYEVTINNASIYRVFYNEYSSITHGQNSMKQLPQSVRVNSPYLHSIYRMQQALL